MQSFIKIKKIVNDHCCRLNYVRCGIANVADVELEAAQGIGVISVVTQWTHKRLLLVNYTLI